MWLLQQKSSVVQRKWCVAANPNPKHNLAAVSNAIAIEINIYLEAFPSHGVRLAASFQVPSLERLFPLPREIP